VKTKRRALVLQGGGALGAYAYGVIRALYEQPDFTMTTSEVHSGASDFSKAAIERRIASGYQDALAQLEAFDRKS
jgi:predicted patatin/cPLA2 family phospholipase